MKKIRADNHENVQKRQSKSLLLIKTAYNKRVASKIEVADWELKVVVPGTEPMWIAFDRRE